MQEKPNTISQPSTSCPTISFSNNNESTANNANGQTYRGIQAECSMASCSSFSVSHYSIHELSGSSMAMKPPQTHSSTHCAPPSKALTLTLDSAFQPLDILCADMNDHAFDLDLDLDLDHEAELDLDSVTIASPMSIEEPASLVSVSCSPKYCNELNSYLVENSDCLQVLNTLSNILLHYKCADIDFNVEYQHQRIDGLVFLSSYCVFWTLHIFDEAQSKQQPQPSSPHNNNDDDDEDSQSKQTRVEFRRTSGDALASAKFWSEIKTLLQKKHASVRPDDVKLDQAEHALDFISLDLSVSGLAAMNTDLPPLGDDDDGDATEHGHISKRELDLLTESLVENDLFVIDELQFLYESMVKHETLCYDVLAHQPLMAQLVNHSMVNQDVCVARAVMLILNLLSQIHAKAICGVDGLQLFENANALLNHRRPLIQKYVVSLLANLCGDECEWKIQESSRLEMVQNVRRYESQCAGHLAQEISKINQKLMTKQ